MIFVRYYLARLITRLLVDARCSMSVSRIRWPSNLESSSKKRTNIFSSAGSVTDRNIRSKYAMAAICDSKFVCKGFPLNICGKCQSLTLGRLVWQAGQHRSPFFYWSQFICTDIVYCTSEVWHVFTRHPFWSDIHICTVCRAVLNHLRI